MESRSDHDTGVHGMLCIYGHVLATSLNITVYCHRERNRLMDLSFKDCFDDELEGPSSLSVGKESRVYCPHCCEEVHRSTFYRHKTKYLLDEPSISQSESDLEMFDGEFHDNREFASCLIYSQESPRGSDNDCNLNGNHDDVDEVENSDNFIYEVVHIKLLGLLQLCSKVCLKCFWEFPKNFPYYARTISECAQLR